MNPERIAIAKTCLDASQDGSMAFPAIVGKLMEAGFDGYAVDYRRNTQIYYLPDGDSAELAMPHSPGVVAAAFNRNDLAALIRWAQSDVADYSYAAFCEQAKAAGCAGYLVSFLGSRVVYYGRTAETHLELFPR